MLNFILVWLLLVLAFVKLPSLPMLFAALSPLVALPIWLVYRWLLKHARSALKSSDSTVR